MEKWLTRPNKAGHMEKMAQLIPAATTTPTPQRAHVMLFMSCKVCLHVGAITHETRQPACGTISTCKQNHGANKPCQVRGQRVFMHSCSSRIAACIADGLLNSVNPPFQPVAKEMGQDMRQQAHC